MTKKKDKPIAWSNNHKIVYSHAYQARISKDHASIEFGTEQPIGENGSTVILSEVQVMVNLKGLKVLSLALQQLIARYESESGEIDIGNKTIEDIQNAVQITKDQESN